MSPSQSVFLKCTNSNSGFQLEIIWKQISGSDQKTFKVFKEKVFFYPPPVHLKEICVIVNHLGSNIFSKFKT